MKLGLRFKLLLMLGIVILAGNSIMFGYASYTMKKSTETQLKDFVLTSFKTGMEILEDKNPGEWKIAQGKLFKGEQPMNDNIAFIENLVPRLGNDNIRLTISQGETKVASNIMNNGIPDVGGEVSPVIWKQMNSSDKPIADYEIIAGERYYTVTDLLRSYDKSIIGVISFAVPTAATDQTIADFNRGLLLIAVCLIVLLLVSAYFFTNQIIKMLSKVGVLTNKVAEGDLTSKPVVVKSKDEIGLMADSINRMILNLRTLIGKVDQASSQVNLSSNQLALSATEAKAVTGEIAESLSMLAATSDSQVRSAEDGSQAVAELAEGIQGVAAAASAVYQESRIMTGHAEEGIVSVEAAVRQMTILSGSVKETSASIEELNRMSEEIEQITGVISGIASQTNLLALNAAIEAARAGEYGRGFSVVAEEIRKLSSQTEQSTKQITGLVSEVLKAARQSDVSMKKGEVEFSKGFERVEKANSAFQKIVGSAQNVTERMQEMSTYSERMSATTEEVAASVEEISGSARQAAIGVHGAAAMAQEESATMEEMAHAAELLKELATDMKHALDQFKL
ncbi:MAG: methyl-accepting chemotaxis protein [Gorillibacterium sp.]|nr:methyl-accepting chemotaxis protein [Gorillibacterium sp.]